VAVATPLRVKAIAHAKIKTDKVDAYTLGRLLTTIPGIGVNVAVGLLATIGDVRRFSSPQKLAAYLDSSLP
jgi:transposase